MRVLVAVIVTLISVKSYGQNSPEWEHSKRALDDDMKIREGKQREMLDTRSPRDLPTSADRERDEVSDLPDGKPQGQAGAGKPSPEAQWDQIRRGASPQVNKDKPAAPKGKPDAAKGGGGELKKGPKQTPAASQALPKKGDGALKKRGGAAPAPADGGPDLNDGEKNDLPNGGGPDQSEDSLTMPPLPARNNKNLRELEMNMKETMSKPITIERDGLPSFVEPRLPAIPSPSSLVPAGKLSFSSLRSPEASPKKRFIFDIYGGGGPNQTGIFSSSLNLRLSDWILGVSGETAQWLDKKTNVGKYTESVYLDVCAAFSLETEWLSLQPCYRGGSGQGRFRQRDATNTIREFERKREVFRFYTRFVTLIPVGGKKVAVEGVSGYSEDVFLYGPYSQVWVKTDLLGLSIGAENVAGQRSSFLLGLAYGATDVK